MLKNSGTLKMQCTYIISEFNLINRYVSFYATVIFLKKSCKLKSSKSNLKFPFSTVYFLGVRRAAAWSYVLGVKHITAALLTANPPLQQDTIPHAVICSLALLMMDIVLPETC
jgi:hypothetical protein